MTNRTTMQRSATSSRITFTVERANRALAFVEPVVRDIVAHYHKLMRLRAQRQDQPGDSAAGDLQAQVDECVKALNHYYRELLEVGCVLKDWHTGLVDFPAVLEGRNIWLCWRLGEPAVSHWHELQAGAAGRQEIDEAFTRSLHGRA